MEGQRIWGLVFNIILWGGVRYIILVAYLLRRNSEEEGFISTHDFRIQHSKKGMVEECMAACSYLGDHPGSREIGL